MSQKAMKRVCTRLKDHTGYEKHGEELRTLHRRHVSISVI